MGDCLIRNVEIKDTTEEKIQTVYTFDHKIGTGKRQKPYSLCLKGHFRRFIKLFTLNRG